LQAEAFAQPETTKCNKASDQPLQHFGTAVFLAGEPPREGSIMKKISTSLAAGALLALSACGGGEDAAANNALTTEVPAEDLTLPADNTLLPADEANGLGTADLNATDLNASDANASDANVTNSY
jgi:hypothetical protein